MTSSSIAVLLEAWQEHQLTNRELIAAARQLTPEDRTILRVRAPADNSVATHSCSSHHVNAYSPRVR